MHVFLTIAKIRKNSYHILELPKTLADSLEET